MSNNEENPVQGPPSSGEIAQTNEEEFVLLRVVGQDDFEVHYRVKVSAQLGTLMKCYCERMGVPLTAYRFVFAGERLRADQTASGLEMENDDAVEVYQEQMGG